MIAVTRNDRSVRLVTPRVAGAALLLASLGIGCGFDTPAPGGGAGSGGSSAPVTGGASGSTAVIGGSGGSASPLPTAGSGGSTGGSSEPTPHGGNGLGGFGGSGGSSGSGGSGGGSGGMSVAGGPPAFTDKPLSVVAYSPYRDGQAPGGAQPTEAQVREDLMLLKPLVDGVRVYGTDGANAFVPKLCDELDIELHIGAWIDGLASDGPNVTALAAVVNQNHKSIKTAIIGNEVLVRSAKNGMTEEKLLVFIEQAKTEITLETVTIAAADTFPQWMAGRPNLANAVDLLIWHTYGWWSGADITNAYTLVSGRYDQMLAMYPGKKMLLGETGWPSMYDHMSTDLSTTAVGSPENQAKFYREALTGFRARNLPVWMFSAIDEQWKGTSGEGAVGAYWGIFDTQRKPKAAASELLLLVK